MIKEIKGVNEIILGDSIYKGAVKGYLLDRAKRRKRIFWSIIFFIILLIVISIL